MSKANYRQITEVLLHKVGLTEEATYAPTSLADEFARKLAAAGVPEWMAKDSTLRRSYEEAATLSERQQVIAAIARGFRKGSAKTAGGSTVRSFVEQVTGEAPRMRPKDVHDAGLDEHEKDWLELLSQVMSEADIPEALKRAEALLRNQFERKNIMTKPADPMAAQASEAFARRLSGQPIRESVSRSDTSSFVRQLTQ